MFVPRGPKKRLVRNQSWMLQVLSMMRDVISTVQHNASLKEQATRDRVDHVIASVHFISSSLDPLCILPGHLADGMVAHAGMIDCLQVCIMRRLHATTPNAPYSSRAATSSNTSRTLLPTFAISFATSCHTGPCLGCATSHC